MAATRWSYDAVAAAYADAFGDELLRKPLDRALLTAFAEQVQQQAPARGRVWDIGCGPGHITAFLAGLGLDTAGIDLDTAGIDLSVSGRRSRHRAGLLPGPRPSHPSSRESRGHRIIRSG